MYDPESGQLLAGSFMDYPMSRADQYPSFITELMEIPSPSNPLGVRAGGEGGTTPAPTQPTKPTKPSKPQPSAGGTYTVKSGDTLSKIASAHHVSLAALEKANPQIKNFNVIQVGEKIHLPGGSTKPPSHTGHTGHTGGTSPTSGHTGGSAAGGKDASKVAREFLGWTEYKLEPSGKLVGIALIGHCLRVVVARRQQLGVVGDALRVVITDFGLARAAQPQAQPQLGPGPGPRCGEFISPRCCPRACSRGAAAPGSSGWPRPRRPAAARHRFRR